MTERAFRAAMVAAAVAILAVVTLAWPQTGHSHALDPGYISIEPLGGDQYRVFFRRPDVQGRPMPLALRLPDRCEAPDAPQPRSDGRAWVAAWVVGCPGGLPGGTVTVAGLENTRTDVLLRIASPGGAPFTTRLTPAGTGTAIPAAPAAGDVALTYFVLGVEHILEGWDHLLFVFALTLLIPGLRQLFFAVTAFTVAHSITLAAATFGLAAPDPQPVEAIIALSIVFLAAELVHSSRSGAPRLSTRWPWLVTFAFGLLHGFGFAGALQEIGLPADAVPLALLAFNLGVEAGQLVFIAVVMSAAAAMRFLAADGSAVTATRPYLAYGIGCIASFWLFERIV